MSEYFLGIDGGASKTLARLGGPKMAPRELRSGPGSLTQNLTGAVATILRLSRQLLAAEKLRADQVNIACGVAGAGNPSAARLLTEHLQSEGFATVSVTSDAQTSLIGAGGGQPMVMVAVGTGSVAMRLGRDGSFRQFGGWGLAVGDEGSGAAIGKSAVRAMLWELDTQGCPKSALCRRIMESVGRRRTDILPWLQHAGSREYAALAPVVFEHLPGCEIAQDIVLKTTLEVEKLIRLASDGEDLPLTILGGLADNLGPLLAEDLQSRRIPPLGTSLDGACAIASSQRIADRGVCAGAATTPEFSRHPPVESIEYSDN
ncbi:BadF/BadG/BcrA/BcrD ATPase family protein [Microbulbifer sp. TYP-18]|uniref:BadF/BadG/BcrA/BcrD ATPase family protein n=1 Tax=Microbulbifer sp. TYP-18 TaxID=3230024 RepID=UPI0034C67A8A